VVQLETQDADAGQLVSFGLDRPNQRDAAAEADVNALNVASLLLRPHRTAGTQEAVLLEESFLLLHDATQHIMPYYLPDWKATLTKSLKIQVLASKSHRHSHRLQGSRTRRVSVAVITTASLALGVPVWRSQGCCKA
jgi:hypothetical protein